MRPYLPCILYETGALCNVLGAFCLFNIKPLCAAVVLRVLTDDSTDPPRRLTAPEAAPQMFHAMFSQVSHNLIRADC